MLVLMCHAGANRYAFDAAHVIEVVPCVNSSPVAEAPDWLAGVFAHRGRAPLVDFTMLITGRPAPRRWNSRIVLVRLSANDMPRQLGLLAERVTTAEIDDAALEPTESSAMEGLGPILLDDRGMLQLVDLSRLLNDDRRSGVQLAPEERTP